MGCQHMPGLAPEGAILSSTPLRSCSLRCSREELGILGVKGSRTGLPEMCHHGM